MYEGLGISIVCSCISVCIGVLVWMYLRDRRRSRLKKEEAERRFLEETRQSTRDPEILRGLEKLAEKNRKK